MLSGVTVRFFLLQALGLNAMTENTCYAIAELDSNGTPVRYLPFLGEGWEPGTLYWLTAARALAWRFGTRQSAQDTADVINSTPGNSPTLHVIEIDCDGPPLNLPPPATLQ